MFPTRSLNEREAHLRHHGQKNHRLGWWILLASLPLLVAAWDLERRVHGLVMLITLFVWAALSIFAIWVKAVGGNDLERADRVKAYLERQRGVVATPGRWRRLSQLLLNLYR